VEILFFSRETNWKLDIVVLHSYRRECFHPPSLVVCLRWLVKCLFLCMLVSYEIVRAWCLVSTVSAYDIVAT
jgi:hypothetical protein